TLDLVVAELGRRAVGDVVPDGVVEQHGILADYTSQCPQRRQCRLPRIDAVDENASRRGLVKPGQQIDERAFAGAAGADERDDVALARAEADVAQYRLRFVREGNAVVLDRTVEPIEDARSTVALRFRLAVQHVE